MTSKEVLTISLEEKTGVWLPDLNKYLVVIPPVDSIIQQLYKGESDKLILDNCISKMGLLPDEAEKVISLVKDNLSEIQKNESIQKNKTGARVQIPPVTFQSKRYYQINHSLFFIEYETTEIEYLIHPKFAHLEIPGTSKVANHFQLFKDQSEAVLMVNEKKIGSWPRDMEHFMAGKVSMEILQKMYNKEENEWMAVFHAAGISNDKESILFLGDSGNGKSTLSAILLATGFDVLADDFLPVESGTSLLCSFPAAISVKKTAVNLLAPIFPALNYTKEFSYPAFNKTVRYLSNPNSAKSKPKKAPCKALVFVKYEANSGLQFSRLKKDIAFQKLIPDSWISPLKTNAKCFLDWFSSLPCYQLNYSDNEAMVKTVKNIFEDAI